MKTLELIVPKPKSPHKPLDAILKQLTEIEFDIDITTVHIIPEGADKKALDTVVKRIKYLNPKIKIKFTTP